MRPGPVLCFNKPLHGRHALVYLDPTMMMGDYWVNLLKPVFFAFRGLGTFTTCVAAWEERSCTAWEGIVRSGAT